MKHDDTTILDQYLYKNVSKRELMREHGIGRETLQAIIGNNVRKEPKKEPICYPEMLFAERDKNLLNYYSALRGETVKHDKMKEIGIRTNSGYKKRGTE